MFFNSTVKREIIRFSIRVNNIRKEEMLCLARKEE